MASESELTVAVAGATGTFGFGLMPWLQADQRVARITGIARRPFDPAAYGWTKMEYRRGDVRDPAALRDAFAGADVIVHLAFLITGAAPAEVIRAVNVDGTLNAFRAAAAAGARRFVYASSVAAYGFHSDNPVGMTEDWPVRPARLFYAREKAELELRLQAEAAGSAGLALYLLRPPLVLGPHAVGAKDLLPGPLAPLGRALAGRMRRFPVPLPALVPVLPLQVVHEEDLGRAFLQCVVAAGPPGAYNIAADGILTAADVARGFGLIPLPLPAGPAEFAARAIAALPFLPPAAQWVEAASHPAIMDTGRAKRELGWAPRFTALETLRDTLRPGAFLPPVRKGRSLSSRDASQGRPRCSESPAGVAQQAEHTGLSERTVRTCLDRLEAAGIVSPCDPGIVSPCDPGIVAARIERAGRRPQGWDLNLSRVRDDLDDAAIAVLEHQFPGLAIRLAAARRRPLAASLTGCSHRTPDPAAVGL